MVKYKKGDQKWAKSGHLPKMNMFGTGFGFIKVVKYKILGFFRDLASLRWSNTKRVIKNGSARDIDKIEPVLSRVALLAFEVCFQHKSLRATLPCRCNLV